MNIIADAFEYQISESKHRPEIDVHNDLRDDQESNLHSASDYECYGLTDKQLQIFRTFFGYRNLEELRQTLIEATDEKYNDLSKDFNIELTVLKDQIKTNTGVSRTRLENLVSGVENILDSVRWRDNKTDLESEESAAQRRNQPGWGLIVSTLNQMLSRLPISLAQLKGENNSEKLKKRNYTTILFVLQIKKTYKKHL